MRKHKDCDGRSRSPRIAIGSPKTTLSTVVTVYEDYLVYVVRDDERTSFAADAETDGTGNLCLWAALKCLRSIAPKYSEQIVCSCCDAAFSEESIPAAFLVLLPREGGPEITKAVVRRVCLACSGLDDEWLVYQGLLRRGLAAAMARAGGVIH